MDEDKENQMEEDKENRMEVDKENLADNSQDSQDSQVSQEDIRAGYRTLIKDLAAAEDTILGADGTENGPSVDDKDEENEEDQADVKTDGLFDHMRQVGTDT